MSGRPIVCHDGKDTNFIAYLQANRNIFYNGGNATQCLLPTAARHPYFASKRGRCCHGRRAQAQPQPKASQPATCRSLRHRPATPAVWQAETGRTAMQERPYCQPIQQTREQRHSRAATMQALPSPVPLPPRSGAGPAIPTKSGMAENARRNKTGPATALQPTNFHARHNSHDRHTLPKPRNRYGKKTTALWQTALGCMAEKAAQWQKTVCKSLDFQSAESGKPH